MLKCLVVRFCFYKFASMSIYVDIQGYLDGTKGLLEISSKYKMSVPQLEMVIADYISAIVKNKDCYVDEEYLKQRKKLLCQTVKKKRKASQV